MCTFSQCIQITGNSCFSQNEMSEDEAGHRTSLSRGSSFLHLPHYSPHLPPRDGRAVAGVSQGQAPTHMWDVELSETALYLPMQILSASIKSLYTKCWKYLA